MTVLDTPPASPTDAATATGPTARSVARSARGPIALLVLLVLAGALTAAVRATGASGLLDPDSYQPDGARALRVLLEDEGVTVRRLEGTAELFARSGDVVVVARPDELTRDDLEALEGALAASADLVLVGAESDVLDRLGIPTDTVGTADDDRRAPACDLPAAVAAGEVEIGGERYRPGPGSGATGCYASGGAATLVRLPEQRVTLLGSGTFLTNDGLGDAGAAALGLGVIGTGDVVHWVVPGPTVLSEEGTGRPLWSLLDMSVRAAALALALAFTVLALWRARRLGRVVVEPLPVVVRAAEAVEGRSRLYEAAGAREAAAESLRAGTRHRLVTRLGLPPDTGRDSLVATAAARAGRDPAGVDALLYGAAPVDDTALVRLADDLDALLSASLGGVALPRTPTTREVAGP
ncbi:MAG: DUF4350 domain-containing protein [Mycobacteriales bacterium]|nr:DUF4350 domain-containing protein [Mycobacteriales bacterium]